MTVLLETHRLRLRQFTQADAAHLFALDNDPDVMRYINGGTPTPYAIIEKEILPNFLRYDDRLPGGGFWATIEKSSDNFVGWVCFAPAETDASLVTLGYRFAKSAWGQGYATEAARALIYAGFTNWGVERVMATTYQDNVASQRVMEKLGMTLVRRFRLTAEDIQNSSTSHHDSAEVWDGDDLEYALNKADWAQQAHTTA